MVRASAGPCAGVRIARAPKDRAGMGGGDQSAAKRGRVGEGESVWEEGDEREGQTEDGQRVGAN